MTEIIFTAKASTARFDPFFSAAVAACANFCAGAREGREIEPRYDALARKSNIARAGHSGRKNRRTIMRMYHAIAVVTVILVGFGLKLTFFSGPTAAADISSVNSVSMDVSEMHRNIKNLPVEKFNDMAFVFSNGG